MAARRRVPCNLGSSESNPLDFPMAHSMVRREQSAA